MNLSIIHVDDMENKIATKARYINGQELMTFVMVIIRTVSQQTLIDEFLYNEIINRVCGLGFPMIMTTKN